MVMIFKKLYKYWLEKKYSDKINIENTNNEVLNILLEKYDLKKININNVDKIFVECAIMSNIDRKNSDISVFKVINNIKSRALYDYAYNKEDFIDENFIIALDKNSDFYVTNFDILQTYLTVIKGISKFDYLNKTMTFYGYLYTLHYFYSNRFQRLFE